MSNTIKTLGDGAITRKALSILHNNLIFCKSIDRQYDDRFAVSGAKIGANLLIREPNQFTVRSGAVMDVQDVTESTQTLTVATQRGVDINYSSAELTLSMDDFADRILEPAMSRLAAEIDSIIITGCAKAVYNEVYTTIGTAPVLADIQSARAKLAKGLAPPGDRSIIMESLSMNSVVADSKGLYSPSSEISRQYNRGLVGHAHGFDFRETEMIPVLTNGSRVDASCVGATSCFTSGTAVINITGGNDTKTIVVGDVFTVAECYAANPETKAQYEHLQQFVCTEAVTTNGSGVAAIKVSPTPIDSGAKQNIVTPSDGLLDGHAVVFVAAGGSGTASTGFPMNLAYHKKAFTMVTADLEVPPGFAHREVFDGISLRIWRQPDIVNDKFPCRIDVYFGYKAVRPEWACRLPG